MKLNRNVLFYFFPFFINSYLISFNQHSVDIVVFTHSRPMQLFAFLDSFKKYAKNYSSVFVLHDCESNPYYLPIDQFFFPLADFINVGVVESAFSQILSRCINHSSEFIAFASDDLIITSEIDFAQCAQLINEYKVDSFMLCLGENIENIRKDKVSRQGEGIIVYDSDFLKKNLKGFNTLLTIYRKKDIVENFDQIAKMSFKNTNYLPATFSFCKELGLILMYEKSKVFRLFIVSDIAKNLQLFSQGYRIDTDFYLSDVFHSIEIESSIQKLIKK